MIKTVKKIWGSEEILVNNERYCSKFLNLKSNYRLSYHYHYNKDEVFYVLGGEVELQVFDLTTLKQIKCDDPDLLLETLLSMKDKIIPKMKRIVLKGQESYRLKPLTLHTVQPLTYAAKILEVSTTHKDEDSYRLIPSGKVANEPKSKKKSF